MATSKRRKIYKELVVHLTAILRLHGEVCELSEDDQQWLHGKIEKLNSKLDATIQSNINKKPQ